VATVTDSSSSFQRIDALMVDDCEPRFAGEMIAGVR